MTGDGVYDQDADSRVGGGGGRWSSWSGWSQSGLRKGDVEDQDGQARVFMKRIHRSQRSDR